MRTLTALGLVIIIAGLVLLAGGAPVGSGGSVGGAVFVGPVPIAFGEGPDGALLAVTSVVIGTCMILLLLFWGRRVPRKTEGEEETSL